MNFLPKSIERLIESLRILPGIGQKSAERLAFFMLKTQDQAREEMAEAILKVKENIGFCEKCNHFTDTKLCVICADYNRDQSLICVVEDWMDLVAIEKTSIFRGLFHVLGGVISPLDSVGPDELKIKELVKRIEIEKPKEIIIATNPSFEGEATAVYILQQLKEFDLKITRLARGLPMGGDLEFTDENTLKRAFEGRMNF